MILHESQIASFINSSTDEEHALVGDPADTPAGAQKSCERRYKGSTTFPVPNSPPDPPLNVAAMASIAGPARLIPRRT